MGKYTEANGDKENTDYLSLIKNAEEELPFLKEHKTCRLSTTQTQRILDLLKQGQLYMPAKKDVNV